MEPGWRQHHTSSITYKISLDWSFEFDMSWGGGGRVTNRKRHFPPIKNIRDKNQVPVFGELVGEELGVGEGVAEYVRHYYDGILRVLVFGIGKVCTYYTCVSLEGGMWEGRVESQW
jgi:hypothetical protein